MDCPFCDIDETRTRIIADKKHVFVALSNPRLMDGHLLVIPRRHVQKLSELNEFEKKELLDTVIEYQEKILTFAGGCDIRQNYRPFQAQSNVKIHHLHMHLQPRELHDELYQKCQIFETGIFKELSQEEIEKIKKAMG